MSAPAVVPTSFFGRRRAAARRRGEQLIPVAIIVAFIALLEAAVSVLDIQRHVLPPPSEVARVVVENWDVLWPEWLVTLQEVGLGLALAFVTAMVLGYAIAHSRILRLSVYPPLIASQTLPVIAIAPILVIWFGYNIVPKVLITALIAFFPLTINTIHGYQSVPSAHRTFFRSLGATRLQTFTKLSLPTAAPQIFAGLKISSTLAVIGATVGEWVGADRGLGHLIVNDSTLLDTPRVFASILLLSISGIVLFALVTLLERLMLPWARVQYAAAEARG